MYKTIEEAAAKVKQFRRIKGKVNFQAECQYQTLLARDHYITTSIYIYEKFRNGENERIAKPPPN
jgi:hypothetical protein